MNRLADLIRRKQVQEELMSVPSPQIDNQLASLIQGGGNFIRNDQTGNVIDLGQSQQSNTLRGSPVDVFGQGKGYMQPDGIIRGVNQAGQNFRVQPTGTNDAQIKARTAAEDRAMKIAEFDMKQKLDDQKYRGVETPAEKLARDKFEWEKSQAGNATAKSTEDEKKAAGYVVRMETALKQMESVGKESPGSEIPNPLVQMVGGVSDTAKNYIQSTARQRIESAQEDALDAALTLATGAAYTKEQLKGLRSSYFPMAGDAPATVEDKRARFADVIKTARLRAGRMEGGADTVISASVQSGAGKSSLDDEAIAWARANPNDPRAKKILQLHGQ